MSPDPLGNYQMATPIPVDAIQALIAAKLAQQGGAPDPTMMADPGLAPAVAPFPTTDPTAVGSLLQPLAQAQQADQAQLVEEQKVAATGAVQALLDAAGRPNPDAWAAQGGPLPPSSALPASSMTDASSGPGY